MAALEGSFHGRTLGALAVTGQPAKRQAFEPLPGLPASRARTTMESLAAAIGPETGARPPGAGARRGGRRPARSRLEAAAELAADRGALLPSTRSRPGWGGQGRSSPGSGRPSGPTSSRSPRASPTASRSAVCSSPTRPRARSSRAITPRRSVGTRSPARRRAPSATRSTKTSLPAWGARRGAAGRARRLGAVHEVARPRPPHRRRARPTGGVRWRGVPRARAPGDVRRRACTCV